MKKTSRKILVFFLVLMAGSLAVQFWAQQQCTEYTENFAENFDTTAYKDLQNSQIDLWPPGPIRLPRLGANFEIAQPEGMGARIYVCDAGDFDGDGYPDLIGLDITGQHVSLPWLSRLILIRNNYPVTGGAGAVFLVDPSKIFEEFNTHTGPASITVADYNGDGLKDFFFMRNSADQFGYTNFLAAMYINMGTANDPVFQPHDVSPNLDFSARYQAAGIYINWAADHLYSVDIDKDGDTDILVISQDRVFLVRNPGVEDFTLDQFGVAELNYDQRTGFTVGLGGSSIATGDFDNYGDIDIVGGTVNDIAYLVYYDNDGLGHFTRRELAIPNPDCTGTVATLAQDFTNNGWTDIFVATDAWNAGNQAHMWMMRNHGLKETTVINEEGEEETVMVVDWEFKCLNNCQPIIPPQYDVDMSAALDYDQDGDMDVILADANHSGDYYLIINELADVFALSGHAQSTDVAQGVIDPREHAITRVRITLLNQGIRGVSAEGLAVKVYFSNNGGRNWEFYAEFEGDDIRNYSDLPWHDFNHFGAQLKWKVEMSATEDEMEEYDSASFESPQIDEINIEYIYVDRREYSRASAAATIYSQSGERRKLIIGASFIFPGWEGQLRAYDVTAMAMTGGNYSSLKTVTSSNLGSSSGRDLASGVEIFWDAGQLLNSRSAGDRNVYTAIRAGGEPSNPLTRIDFNAANAAQLAPFLQDFNNDNAGLINFVCGDGRDWKLGDINHSTPVIVGPPDGYPSLMGTGYAEFKQSLSERPKVIYVGANEGMLHCFDLVTGEERWAFIPYNLLPKLRNMWAVDTVNNSRYFAHDVYVDGTPAVADVYINAQWRTVLVCGQGPGAGSTMAGGGINYYFALDITDPDNPLPLWEFTHLDNQNRPTLGETWSVPAIGRVKQGSNDRWVAFMGSGYDNTQLQAAGNRFYVVRIDTGALIRQRTVNQVNTANFSGAKRDYRYTNIKSTIPGSPTAVDSDQNGYVDYVYFGDLDGRLYKLNVTSSTTSSWNLTALYTDWLNHPIITKPAVYLDPFSGSPIPRVFFGTGGDDRAPGNRTYAFLSLIDGSSPEIEWYLGDPTVLNLPAETAVGSLSEGEKVWADPVISDFIVYFSTLRGSIENVNPCINLEDIGHLYARYIRNVAGTPIGGTAFKSAVGPALESLQLVSKARRAVTVGEVQRLPGALNKREIYIQEYDSTIEMLEQPVGSLLRIKSWREIYKVIR
ncbi:MAG: PilC/PilY family type IV pilus protein [Candidatus Aminicenantales bacterium]